MNAPVGRAADAETIRNLAAEILQRPEYASARASEDILAPLKWFLEGLEQLLGFFRWFDGLRHAAPVVYWLVFAGLLTVLALLIAHICWAVSRALRESAEIGQTREVSGRVDFSDQARSLAGEGRYLEAAHRLLLATLQHSARAGLIELRPEDTNRKVRERLNRAGLPARLRGELLALMLETERAWFRDREDDAVLYQRWSAAYGNLTEATG